MSDNIPRFKEMIKMNELFNDNKNNPAGSLLTIYLRYTHLDVSVFADILQHIYKMHQTIVGVFNNTFMFSDVYKEGVRNVLYIDSLATATPGNSTTMKLKEGWAPAFLPATDDSLVEVPKTLGIPVIIASLLVSTIDKAIVSNSNFLEGAKKALEKEIQENKECKIVFDALQQSAVKRKLEEQALLFVQVTKSIEAVRSVSFNGVNILSFDVNRRKYKRYFMNLPVTIVANNATLSATIQNISRGGCVARLNDSREIPGGQPMILRFPECAVTSSEVATWKNGDKSFMRAIFSPPMEEGQLHSIVKLS
jgi:hypothetical protein